MLWFMLWDSTAVVLHLVEKPTEMVFGFNFDGRGLGKSLWEPDAYFGSNPNYLKDIDALF